MQIHADYNDTIKRNSIALPRMAASIASYWCHGLRLLCFYSGLVLLTGCWSHPLQDAADEYGKRLSRVLERPLPALESSPPSVPNKRDFMNIPSVETSINLREFYALRDCPVYTQIAERNTALGKVQTASQRLLYEVEINQLLARCETQLKQQATTDTADGLTADSRQADSQPAIYQKLAAWRASKQTSGVNAWKRVIQASDETYRGWFLGERWLHGVASEDGVAETLAAINYLTRLGALDKPSVTADEYDFSQVALSGARLETSLQDLTRFRLIANHHLTSMQLEAHVRQWQPLVDGLVDIDCSDQRVPILLNVFKLFFLEKIQPYIGQLNQYRYQFAPLLQQLLAHPHLDHEFTSALSARLQRAHLLTEQTKAHVKPWQQLFARCNIQPTSL